jgi:hypothetical protein
MTFRGSQPSPCHRQSAPTSRLPPAHLDIGQLLRFGAVNANTDGPLFKDNNYYYYYDYASGPRAYIATVKVLLGTKLTGPVIEGELDRVLELATGAFDAIHT